MVTGDIGEKTYQEAKKNREIYPKSQTINAQPFRLGVYCI